MPSLVDLAASRIAEATAPQSQQSAVRWRWGTVEAVNADGTMDVDIAGSTVPSVTALHSATSANVGDRVRVDYLGTDAVVTGVAANGVLATVPEIQSGSYAIPAGSGISGTGYKDYRIYFDTAFQATPQVVAVLSGGSTAGEMGKITLGVPAVTKTYFDARLWASDVATSRNPAIRWIGINGDATASGGGGGGGGGGTIDAALSDTSTNAVQNKVIKAALDALIAVETLYDSSTITVKRSGRTVMVQAHGVSVAPSTSTAVLANVLADYKPEYNISTTVLTSSGGSTQAARMVVYASNGGVYIVPAGYSSSASWYGTLTYIY